VRWWPIALLVLLAGCSESHGSASTTQPLRTAQLVKVYIAAGSGHLYLDDFSAVQVATAALRIPQVASCGSVPCVTYGHLVAPGA
jgi:hypothetical protein